MLKRICLSLILLMPFVLAAQDISTYYAPAEGLADSCLKSALSAIISDTPVVRVHYGTGGYVYDKTTHKYTDEYYPGTWDMFRMTDAHGDGTIWDMYSTTRRYFPIDNGSACGMAIEHSFPKSWWGGEENDAYKDLHHLCPADYSANSSGKSNYPPGVVDSLQKWTNGFFRQGYMAGHPSHRVFEPADIYKGDFARAYFYIVTCYEQYSWKSADANCPLLNDSYLEFEPWLADVLLAWHRADPVSDKEIRRHAAVASIQHNRNPFIDYPELVEYIWGNRQGEALALSSLTCTADTLSYQPQSDGTDLRWLPVVESKTPGLFTLQWTAVDDEMQLAVYKHIADATADTLVALPAVTATIIDQTEHVSYSGRLNTTGAGNKATIMGVSSTDGTISLSGILCPADTYLRFRASWSYTAGSAELQIVAFANGVVLDTVADLLLLQDETFYTLPVPQGVDSISITSVGGSTKQRAAMQQIWLLASPEEAARVPLYDATIAPLQTSAEIDLSALYATAPDALDSVYCSLTPAHGIALPSLKLTAEKSPVEATVESVAACLDWRQLGDAEVRVYSMSGVLVYMGPASQIATLLPANQVYILHSVSPKTIGRIVL